MKLIVFATHLEADATLTSVHAKEVHKHMYQFDAGWILIAGVGAHKAQAFVMQTIIEHRQRIQEVWNVGFAGLLNSAFALGTCLAIKEINKNIIPQDLDNHSLSFLAPTIDLAQESGARLLTLDYPLHNKAVSTNLKNRWDLIDMEGYGIAYATQFFGLPCRMWKIVSDFASEDGHSLIQKNARQLSSCLADQINMLLA